MAGVLAIAAYALARLARREPLILPTPELKLCLGLALWAVITTPFSIWPGGSIATLQEPLAKSLIVAWLVSAVVSTSARFRRVAWALCLMAIPAALGGILNYLAGVRLQDNGNRILGYPAPLSGNPNDLALLLNLLLPFAIGLFLGSRTAFRRLLLAGVVVLMVAGVIVSFSRGGFITLMVVLAVYGVKLRRRREGRLVWAVILMALMALPILPGGYVDRVSTISSVEADPTGSAQERTRDMALALAYVLTHPVVGAGLGQDSLLLNELRGNTWTRVHNIYLGVGVDLGWFGLGLFVTLLVRAFKNAREASRQWERGNRELFFLAQGLHVSLIAFAMAAMFHPGSYFFPFYYLVGLSVALRQLGQRQLAATTGPR
jgi:hypothetical protein